MEEPKTKKREVEIDLIRRINKLNEDLIRTGFALEHLRAHEALYQIRGIDKCGTEDFGAFTTHEGAQQYIIVYQKANRVMDFSVIHTPIEDIAKHDLLHINEYPG